MKEGQKRFHSASHEVCFLMGEFAQNTEKTYFPNSWYLAMRTDSKLPAPQYNGGKYNFVGGSYQNYI